MTGGSVSHSCSDWELLSESVILDYANEPVKIYIFFSGLHLYRLQEQMEKSHEIM